MHRIGRPHDVIAPPGGRTGDRPLRPGPRARGKWLAGSVRKDPGEVIAAGFSEGVARDHAHQRFHLECEHQRLYPGTTQGQYTLVA